MFIVKVKNPEGETIDLLTTPDEGFAHGARAGVSALLKILETDMDFEEGYVCDVQTAFDAKPQVKSTSWVSDFLRSK